MSFLKTCLRAASALLAPQSCVLCEEWVLEEDLSPLCRSCLQALPRLPARLCNRCGIPVPGDVLQTDVLCGACRFKPPHFDSARAWGPYRGDLRKLLHAFKFQGLRRLAHPLAGLLEDRACWPSPGARPDWLIPIPSHPRRVRQRGFNPPGLLGRLLARRLALPLFTHVCRTRHTAPQTGLTEVDRRHNLTGAFRVSRPELLEGKRVVLLDDILTTGTTASELALTLKESVAVQWIEVLTLARVIRWTSEAATLGTSYQQSNNL